jgi:hypothetical protein
VLLALTVLALLSLAVWMGIAAIKVTKLEDDASPEPPVWPSVSLLVPARDEEHGVEAALQSKLAIDYPALEVVFIDDRSTDGTGAIADRLAKEDPRLKVVHVTQLPDGWLGKVHALHRGAQAATGEWLLPTDADIHFAPATLKKAMARCLRRGDDVLAAFPAFKPSTLLIDAVLADFARTVLAPLQTDQVEDPTSKVGIGVGVFTLVRRAAYDASPGWEDLKLEIADDVTLGMVLKRSGARCSVVLARSYLQLTMYPTFDSLVKGVEKSACALGRYRLLPQVLVQLLMLGLDVVPWLALGVGLHRGDATLIAAGGLAGALVMISSAVAVSVLGLHPWRALLSPFGGVLFHLLLLVTGLQAHARGGVRWRGTLYPLAALRAGMRFKLPWQA